MKLHFHQKTFELLGAEPMSSHITWPVLPLAVAEWFSLPNAVELLEKYSNQDQPLEPTKFRHYFYENRELAVFMDENQGVCWWETKLVNRINEQMENEPGSKKSNSS